MTIFSKRTQDSEQLLKEADLAMYASKDGHLLEPAFFSSELMRLAHERKTLEKDLDKAFADDEFGLYFQPQFGGENATQCGIEVLVRWNYVLREMMLPEDFVPVIDASRLTLNLSNWVIRDACRAGRQSLGAGYEFGRLAVNLSVEEFYRDDLAARVESLLQEISFSANKLEIEITERSVMR